MKVHFEFNLPEDKAEHMYALKGADAHFVLEGLAQELRQVYKYSDSAMDIEYAEKWRDRLFELMDDYGVKLYGEY